MSISKTPNGKWKVSVKWGSVYKYIGLYPDIDDAVTANEKALAERPASIPRSRNESENIDTFGLLNRLWKPQHLELKL